MNLFQSHTSFVRGQGNHIFRLLIMFLLIAALPVFIWAVLTQRIELRKRAATSEPTQICWNRVISGGGSWLWPNSCKGSPRTDLICTQITIPLSAEEITQYQRWIAAGRPYIPGCDMAANSVDWKTNYASLKSSDFYIRIGSKKFYNVKSVRISSDPGITRTTLEAIWSDQGVEMRLFMYFRKIQNNTVWEMYQLDTYNGNSPGDWIDYNIADTKGRIVQSSVGMANTYPDRVFKPKNNSDAEIVCTNCTINAFFTPPPPLSQYGYSLEALIGLAPGQIITLTTQPNTGYGVNVVLRDSLGVVKNQSGFTYTVRADNPSLVRWQTGPVDYGNGLCAYDIVAPCPYSNIQLSGTAPGSTFIRVSVTRKSDNAVVAETSFPIRITGTAQTITPTPTCVPRPACLDPLPGQPQCMISIPPNGWFCPKASITPTPTPSGCYYKPVQCFQAPCEPVLVCPPTTCTGVNGTACTVRTCTPYQCPTGMMCPAIAGRCTTSPGICQNGKCVSTTPTPVCKTGVNSFALGAACPSSTGTYSSATVICYDGFRTTVGGNNTCTPADILQTMAQRVCSGRSSCTPTPTPTPYTQAGCIRSGCNGELCVAEGSGGLNSACIARPSNACYKSARCEKQSNGICGWTQTDELKQCLAGTTVTPTPSTLQGDLNGDGRVTVLDYNILLGNFGKTGKPGFTGADINRDGKVNVLDFNILLKNFGQYIRSIRLMNTTQ